MPNQRPKVLYHASSNSEIEVFEPRREKVRDPEEGPVVFATHDKALASAFLVRTDGSWVKIGRFTESGITTPWHFIASSRRRFMKSDFGGAIYYLPVDTFNNDSEKGMGSVEWVSRVPVKPVDKDLFESGFDAMRSLGVDVYFVSRRTFRKIDKSEDHGRDIIQSLRKES